MKEKAHFQKAYNDALNKDYLAAPALVNKILSLERDDINGGIDTTKKEEALAYIKGNSSQLKLGDYVQLKYNSGDVWTRFSKILDILEQDEKDKLVIQAFKQIFEKYDKKLLAIAPKLEEDGYDSYEIDLTE